MQIVPETTLWLTLREAAEYAHRSYSWAWERSVLGILENAPDGQRPRRVSAASVAQALQYDLARNGVREFAKRTKRRPKLRLVIDNTLAK